MPSTPHRSVVAHLPRLAVVLLASALLPAPGQTADTLPLGVVVDFCPLIVKCRIERDDRGLRYRVLESWKGTYRPDRFEYSPSDGYFRPKHWPVHNPTEGQEIIFFFDTYQYGSMLKVAASFPVTNGQIAYNPSDIFGRSRYTVAGFKRAVIAYSDPDARGAVFGGAAAWWLRVSAVSEGQSLLMERLRNAKPSVPLEQAPETAPAGAAGEPRNGDVNRATIIVLVVATSLLVIWLVYRSLRRRTPRQV